MVGWVFDKMVKTNNTVGSPQMKWVLTKLIYNIYRQKGSIGFPIMTEFFLFFCCRGSNMKICSTENQFTYSHSHIGSYIRLYMSPHNITRWIVRISLIFVYCLWQFVFEITKNFLYLLGRKNGIDIYSHTKDGAGEMNPLSIWE